MFPLGACWSCCSAPPPVHLWPGLARGHLAQLVVLGHVEMSDYKVASQCPSARCQPSPHPHPHLAARCSSSVLA